MSTSVEHTLQLWTCKVWRHSYFRNHRLAANKANGQLIQNGEIHFRWYFCKDKKRKWKQFRYCVIRDQRQWLSHSRYCSYTKVRDIFFSQLVLTSSCVTSSLCSPLTTSDISSIPRTHPSPLLSFRSSFSHYWTHCSYYTIPIPIPALVQCFFQKSKKEDVYLHPDLEFGRGWMDGSAEMCSE